MFVGAILHNLGNLTAPTTSTDNKEKINSSSATLLTPRTTIVGTRDAVQHLGIHRSGRRSSSMATSTSPPRRGRRVSDTSR
ncbi:MAG: hypothetical protein ACRDTD_05490, partial [Pseudonocardiaceae bacterium]